MRFTVLAISTLAIGLSLACGSTKRSAITDDDDGGGGGSGTSGSGTSGGPFTTSEAGVAIGPCVPAKGNYDFPGNNCDDDADGTVDNPPVSCDANLAATGSADDFAKGIGVCATAPKDGYGVVSATFTRGYGLTDAPKDGQHGLLPKFGDVVKPREGKMLGVLSSGYAQEYDGAANAPFGGSIPGKKKGDDGVANGKDWWDFANDPNPFVQLTGNGKAPPGYPKASFGCSLSAAVNDVIDVKLTLQAPKNASGIKFDFDFYSGEWPAFVCSNFNDGFIAYLSAKGFNGGKADNMSYDAKKNPVSVNNGFFDRCTPGVDTGCANPLAGAISTCPGGPAELAGTGFGIDGAWCDGAGKEKHSTNGGATGWLTSQAPVQAGETFTLEFMIWDTGDAVLDSSVLIDNFSWIEGDVMVTTDRPR